ncbi:MAG: hypothetical protein RMM17_09855 [Acidobacteriota bacterium]|nr:hypothetical protein [Blastocatellia bacterium]MDW8412972.1 hypothetical protein [Acidobacteriota bacterium]
MQRIILESADIIEKMDGSREAVVVLRSDTNENVGITAITDEAEAIQAVAKATLHALKRTTPLAITAELATAGKIRPEGMKDFLYIVKVELGYGQERFSLTGTCMGREDDIATSAAKATLDATNRVLEYLTETYDKR